MTELTDYLLVCFGTLFAVLIPLAPVPPFLAMTDSDMQDNRLQMARRACIVACLVLLIFSVSDDGKAGQLHASYSFQSSNE